MQGIFLIALKHWYNVSMEIDMNENSWSNPCPKYDCRKAACKCGLGYVSIPAALGDDSAGSEVSPKNGAYCNAIVKYESNGHVYVYSKDGIPVLVNGDQCHCLPNLVVNLPNGITEYGRGEAPISYDDVEKAFEQGRSIFFKDYTYATGSSIYVVTAFNLDDGIRSIKVERAGIGINTAGFWLIQSDHSDSWENIHYFPSVFNEGD